MPISAAESHTLSVKAATVIIKDGLTAGMGWSDLMVVTEGVLTIVLAFCAEVSDTPDKVRFGTEVLDSLTEATQKRFLDFLRKEYK